MIKRLWDTHKCKNVMVGTYCVCAICALKVIMLITLVAVLCISIHMYLSCNLNQMQAKLGQQLAESPQALQVVQGCLDQFTGPFSGLESYYKQQKFSREKFGLLVSTVWEYTCKYTCL